MKKIFFVAAVAFLAGCGQQNVSETAKNPPSTKSADQIAIEKLFDKKYPDKLSPKVFRAAKSAAVAEILRFINEKNDPKWCAKLLDGAESSKCSNNFAFREALKTADIKKCGPISDGNLQTLCFDEVKKAIAVKDADPEKCADLSDAKNAQKCRAMVITQKAQKEQDPEICQQISDKFAARECTQMVSLFKAVSPKK